MHFASFSYAGTKAWQQNQIITARTSPDDRAYLNYPIPKEEEIYPLTKATIKIETLDGALEGNDAMITIPIETFYDPSQDFCYVVELFADGELKLGVLIRFKFSASSHEQGCTMPTRAELALIDNSSNNSNSTSISTVDIGQMTTLWPITHPRHHAEQYEQQEMLGALIESLAKSYKKAQQSFLQELPLRAPELAMESLYNSYKGRGRNDKNKNHKNKKIEQIVEKALKKRLLQQTRIACSKQAAQFLYNSFNSSCLLHRRMAGAIALGNDAKYGGRFKRIPCMAFSSPPLLNSNNNTSAVQLINGGWLAVDNSLKKAAEGRKFAERASSSNSKTDQDKSTLDLSSANNNIRVLLTEADERIACKLECLAMGEQHQLSDESLDGERMFEVEVRSALQAMSLPISIQGAQDALLLLGRWSQHDTNINNTHNKVIVQPWPKDVMDAAREFIAYNEKVKQIYANNRTKDQRVDLTRIPSICIDAPKTKFRDDAISVRPRKKERIVPGAGKWEILIHIADLSDLYSPNPITTLATFPNASSISLLRNAAASRGLSRYDLPRGPLHLLPPIMLESLALATTPSSPSRGSDVNVINKSVTFWAYIDERDGKILDSGLERTLISSPVRLSYNDASELLINSSPRKINEDSNGNIGRSNEEIAAALLRVIDRTLAVWADRIQANNSVYQKRENRFKTKILIQHETHQHDRIHGSSTFQRTPGHVIVDRALDLYANGVTALLRRKGAKIPRASGAGEDRGGRLGTGPLRRYIDGIAQRQALSVLCEYGGSPMTESECLEASKVAASAYNAIDNYSAIKKVDDNGIAPIQKAVGGNAISSRSSGSQQQQKRALRLLAREMAKRAELAGDGDKNGSTTDSSIGKIVQAMATGRQNQVIISGVGATAICREVHGTLSPGERVSVQIIKLNPDEGRLVVKLVQRGTEERR